MVGKLVECCRCVSKAYPKKGTSVSTPRPGWNKYFMSQAYVAATRATCNRKHVGAVLVDSDHHVIATGYNGSPPGQPHCGDDNHFMVEGHCVRTIHAETNALLQAAKAGRSVHGATCYSTVIPCYDCAKHLVTAGTRKVVFHEFYNSRYDASDQVSKLLDSCGVVVEHYKDFSFPKRLVSMLFSGSM